MSTEEEKTVYRIIGTNIRHGGKIHKAGRRIALGDEDALRLKDFLEPLDSEDAATGNEALQSQLDARDKAIQELVDELQNHQAAMATLIEEHAADLQERDATITDLNIQIAELQTAAPVKEKGGKK